MRDWVALDAEHRRAIETRLDHNAAGTEPAPNPALLDQLATEMTKAPSTFARRDLVPAVAHLPLPQWQRFRDWQAGIKRNDPATEDQRYAIKRGLQLANKMLPADAPDDDAVTLRAALVEEIDTWRRINGKSPSDDDIAGIFKQYVTPTVSLSRTLEGDLSQNQEIMPLSFVPPLARQGNSRYRPGIHHVEETNEPEKNQGDSEKDRAFWDVVRLIRATPAIKPDSACTDDQSSAATWSGTATFATVSDTVSTANRPAAAVRQADTTSDIPSASAGLKTWPAFFVDTERTAKDACNILTAWRKGDGRLFGPAVAGTQVSRCGARQR